MLGFRACAGAGCATLDRCDRAGAGASDGSGGSGGRGGEGERISRSPMFLITMCLCTCAGTAVLLLSNFLSQI